MKSAKKMTAWQMCAPIRRARILDRIGEPFARHRNGIRSAPFLGAGQETGPSPCHRRVTLPSPGLRVVLEGSSMPAWGQDAQANHRRTNA